MLGNPYLAKQSLFSNRGEHRPCEVSFKIDDPHTATTEKKFDLVAAENGNPYNMRWLRHTLEVTLKGRYQSTPDHFLPSANYRTVRPGGG